jgi:putative dimethyl sulfoxide reductase chaperone
MLEFDLDQAIAREDMCRFLAACYYEPVSEFTEEHLFDSMLEAARRIDPVLFELVRKLGEDFEGQDLQTLLIDYTRLFLGPSEALARPYGSFWLSGEKTVMRDSTMAALALYRQGGLELGEAFHEVPDHVAVELEFLYLLAFTSNQAQQAGLDDELLAATRLERQFLSEHIGAWVTPFAAAIKSGAETAFYRRLAELTEYFVCNRKASLCISQ